MSADSAAWWIRKQIRIPIRSFWSWGPTVRRSFKEAPLADLAEASKTTLSFVVLLASLMKPMTWQGEIFCESYLKSISGNFFHVSNLNKFVNEPTLYVVYISGCICSKKMRLRSLLSACWYESLRGLGPLWKRVSQRIFPLSFVGWYFWSDLPISVHLKLTVLLLKNPPFPKVAVGYLFQNKLERLKLNILFSIWLSRSMTRQPKQDKR